MIFRLSSQPGTGCHGSNGSVNAHGSVNQVLAARTFKYDNIDMYAAADFALCFDCHANYPGFTKEDILGVKAGAAALHIHPRDPSDCQHVIDEKLLAQIYDGVFAKVDAVSLNHTFKWPPGWRRGWLPRRH
jgi:hypothetical protein